MYLNNSNKHIFASNQELASLKEIHSPYFLLRWDKLTDDARKDFEKYVQTNTDIAKVGEEETYESSVRFTATTREKVVVKKIFCKYPSLVPTVSDDLFLRYRNYGAELYQFDIPYRSLVLLENCASNVPGLYLFNTNSKDETLKILSYDIETLNDGTICIIGYSSFDITVNSYFDITKEKSKFEIVQAPNWEDVEVKQLICKPEEEHKALYSFVKIIMEHDIVSGHNVLAFDNKEFVERIKYHVEVGSYGNHHLKIINEFLSVYTQETKMFNMGKTEEAMLIYPNSLDTLLAFRRLYANLPSYTLKNLAKEFNINIKDRVYFNSTDFNKITKDSYETELFKKFIKYNEHDVIEQNGLTLIALPSILAMSFLTCSPLDEIVIKSNTKAGDNVGISRCLYHKRIFPPTLSADRVCKELLKIFDKCYLSKEDLSKISLDNKILLKSIKYGDEMPLFVYHPALIVFSETTGGLTAHPNDDYGHLPSTDAYLLPFYKIINPDVASLYPTILKAKNSCSDSVRFALKEEEVQEWIWIRNFSDDEVILKLMKLLKIERNWLKFNEKNIINKCIYHTRKPKLGYQTSGIEIGVVINQEEGMLAKALGGVIELTTKIKHDKKIEKDKDRLDMLTGLYASLKSVRNSFTHGLILAFPVSCRQSNLAAGSLIPSTGNKIMFDIYEEIKKLE